jgi:hypothetical protein
MFVRRLVFAVLIGTPVAGFSHPGHGIVAPHLHGGSALEWGVAAAGLIVGCVVALRGVRRS